MERDNCEYFQVKGRCYYGIEKRKGKYQIHVGTEDKLEILRIYSEAWIRAILTDSNNKYRQYSGAVFVDCMSSGGEYINKLDKQVMGTSLNVLEILGRMKKVYPNKKLKLIINDKGDQEILCQNCRIEQNNNGNIEVEINKLDVREFLSQIKDYSDLGENFHVLLFYDPFKAEIYWDEIGKYLKGSRFDLILTHFHQNDTQRAINKQNISMKIRQKYEKTYGVSFDEISSRLYGKNGREMNIILRELIIKNMKKVLGNSNSYVSCLPVFNQKNKDVYDIVLYSKSAGALEKFKNSVYEVMSKRLEEYDKQDQKELSLATDLENQARIFDMTDIHYFYSVKTYARIIAIHFSKRRISNSELGEYIKLHDFIPTNIKERIDLWLIDKFEVVIEREHRLKYYKFPEVGEGEIL